jgi:hypothetical protein
MAKQYKLGRISTVVVVQEVGVMYSCRALTQTHLHPAVREQWPEVGTHLDGLSDAARKDGTEYMDAGACGPSASGGGWFANLVSASPSHLPGRQSKPLAFAKSE